MERSIDDYDQSLVDLDRQKEQLELVMQRMGEEWEESGPGINWLKTLQSPPLRDDDPMTMTATAAATAAENDQDNSMCLISPITPDSGVAAPSLAPGSLQTNDDDDKLFHILQQSQPSPEYLQSLLHVNETLLAQSLATAAMDNANAIAVPVPHSTHHPTPASTLVTSSLSLPIHTTDPQVSNTMTSLNTPPMTPGDDEDVGDHPRLIPRGMTTIDTTKTTETTSSFHS